jgi:hypothetical protein
LDCVDGGRRRVSEEPLASSGDRRSGHAGQAPGGTAGRRRHCSVVRLQRRVRGALGEVPGRALLVVGAGLSRRYIDLDGWEALLRRMAHLSTCAATLCSGFRTSFWTSHTSWRVAAQAGEPIQSLESANVQAFRPMARPGLEPGTPRFSGSRRGAIPLTKDLQNHGFQSDAVWRDGVGSGRFRVGLGLRRGLRVPMSLRPQRTGGPSDALPAEQSTPAGLNSHDSHR